MKRLISFGRITFALLAFFVSSTLFAQFTLTGQYRTRTEFRAGQGTLPAVGYEPTLFTNSRMRLNVGLTADRFKFFTSIQDVRTWGQNASTTSNLDGNSLFMHEAWGEVQLNDSSFLKHIDFLGFKVGRQELVYDDEKLLGSLDWSQQARSHDAIVLKFLKKTLKADAGFAFNQSKEYKNSGTIYSGVPPTQLGPDGTAISSGAGTNGIGIMYKAMQFIYVSKEFGLTKITGLYFNENFQKRNSITGVFEKGTNNRTTVGISVFGTIMGKHKIDAQAFYQGNQDKSGKTMDGFMLSLSTQFALGEKITTGPGVDYLSGNNTLDSTSNVNKSFDPLYGTPHKFWGFMDYFYVADSYGLQGANGSTNKRSPGLININWRTKYKLRENLIIKVDIHEFFAGNQVANVSTPDLSDKMNSRLGTEIDFVLNYNLTKSIGFECGYSAMFGTETLSALKLPVNTVPNDKYLNGQWAYFMINIRPDFTNFKNLRMKEMKKNMDELNKKITALEAASQF